MKILAQLHPEIHVLGGAGTVDEAVEKIHELRPNLLFLDIMILNRTVFEIFDQINTLSFEVIFTTAHDDFALRAFRINAMDYLLKPIDLDDLAAAIRKAKEKLAASTITAGLQFENLTRPLRVRDNAFNKMAIPTIDGFILTLIDDIIYCESDGNYTHFFLKDNKKITSSYTMKQYEELLAGGNFFRIHKSHIVNLAHITRYIKGDGGVVRMSNGKDLEVSRSQKLLLLELIRV